MLPKKLLSEIGGCGILKWNFLKKVPSKMFTWSTLNRADLNGKFKGTKEAVNIK